MKSTYKLYNGYDIKGIPDIHDQFTKIAVTIDCIWAFHVW